MLSSLFLLSLIAGSTIAGPSANSCQSCPVNSIKIVTPQWATGYNRVDDGCTERVISCKDPNKIIRVWEKKINGAIDPGYGYAMVAKCNGAAWMYEGKAVNQFECVPACWYLPDAIDACYSLFGTNSGRECIQATQTMDAGAIRGTFYNFSYTCPGGSLFFVGSNEQSVTCSDPRCALTCKNNRWSDGSSNDLGFNLKVACLAFPATTTTTKKVPMVCPVGGVWSEWETTGPCATTCGGCSVAARKRTCTTMCGDCPCEGPSEDVGPCGLDLCKFPSPVGTCCAPKKKLLNLRTNIFYCGVENDIYNYKCTN